MQKRKMYFLIIAIIFVGMIGVTVFLLLKENNSYTKQFAKELELMLEENYYVEEKQNTVEEAIALEIKNRVSWKLVNVKETECELEITYPDAASIFYQKINLYGKEPTEEEVATLMKQMLQELKSDKAEKQTVLIAVDVVNGRPQMNDALVDALSGGLLTSYTELLDNYMKQHMEELRQ